MFSRNSSYHDDIKRFQNKNTILLTAFNARGQKGIGFSGKCSCVLVIPTATRTCCQSLRTELLELKR